jgi:formylglycine-generating enzyme required for sulfatase activity
VRTKNIFFLPPFCLAIAVLVLTVLPFASAETGDQELPKKVNTLGMEFVLIPAGSFQMGSPPTEKYRDKDEELHEVTISKPFHMQTTEVTQGQWKAVMGDNPSGAENCGKNCPVERVSWNDCQNFISKLNKMGIGKYRLPTEAEWEYACRAGSTAAYSWGDKIDCRDALFANNTYKGPDTCVSFVKKHGFSSDEPVPVKTYPPNKWGLYDMHGNVWEWCQDWYGKYPAGPETDPTGPSKGHMKARRGGSFFKYPWYLRSANRNRGNPQSRFHTQGLRLVMETE